MTKKNILILGSAGFIGCQLVNHLNKYYNIISVDRVIRKDSNNSSVFLNMDFCTITKEDFLNILDSYYIDVIYHCISTTIPSERTDYIDVEVSENVLPTLRLLEAMVKSKNSKKLIFISSGGTVYGETLGRPHMEDDLLNPICGYGMHKMITEKYLRFYARKYNLSCFIARLSNPYGVIKDQNRKQGIIPLFISCLVKQQPIVLYGDTVRDFIYINDAIEALIKLIDYSGENKVFNIGSGQGTHLIEIVHLIENISGRKFINIINYPIRSCDVRENILNIARTTSELNWIPKTDLYEGIKEVYKKLIV